MKEATKEIAQLSKIIVLENQKYLEKPTLFVFKGN